MCPVLFDSSVCNFKERKGGEEGRGREGGEEGRGREGGEEGRGGKEERKGGEGRGGREERKVGVEGRRGRAGGS